MLSRVMDISMNDSKIREVDRHIKIFLNCYAELDRNLPLLKPRWIQKSNFLSLLNIPEILSVYGPIRNYWEGSCLGEKILQLPKGIWHGFTLNWSLNMLTNITQTGALERIRHRLDSLDHNVNEGAIENNKEGLFRRYQNLEQVKHAFLERSSLSCIILNDSSHVIVLKTNHMVHISFDTLVDPTVICGDIYHTCSIPDATQVVPDDWKSNIMHYALMLPCIATRGQHNYKSLWTFVTSEWLSINNIRHYGLPKLSGITYDH